MKITEINVVPKNFELAVPFKFASCCLNELSYALVQIKTDEGITGYGECPAYWDPSGETQESTIGAIKFIRSSIEGKSPFQIEQITGILDSNVYGAHAAKCGLDMALLDIQGKKLGIPVYQLLGGNNNEVNVNSIISLSSIDEAVEKAKKDLTEGFEYFKVKVGTDLDRDVEVLSALRRELGSGIKLFVDANQGWKDYKTALRAIQKFSDVDLSWVEQPVLAYDWNALEKLTSSVSISIMADESLYTYQDAFKMARNGTVDLFNIKLAKSGGMYLGAKIYAIAQAANIPCVLGSMIESSLGQLANYNFAKSYKMVTCGLNANRLIINDFDFGLKIEKGKLIVPGENPGLGYSRTDEEQLKIEFER